MAVITEEPDPQPATSEKEPTLAPKNAPNLDPKTKPDPKNPSTSSNPFVFWFYFTISAGIIALTFAYLYSLYSPTDPRSFFLSLPTSLREHYSKGRLIKVQFAQNQAPMEVFALESGNSKVVVSEKVVIVHGLGLNSFGFRKVVDFLASKGVHGVVFDLPGHGFSDKAMEVIEGGGSGVFERLMDVYSLIKKKGVFWAFDNIVESGELPYEEIQSHFSRKKRSVVRPAALGSEEMGMVLGQVIETLGLAPVHLVLHDSSLSMVGNWVSENVNQVRSVTLVDTGSRPALPVWILESPAISLAALAFNSAYGWLIRLCCSKGIDGSDLEAHRVIFRASNGLTAVMGMYKRLNSSFCTVKWGGSDGIKGTPLQVIWSSSWSKGWSKEGRKVAKALPLAKFVTHSGGRWPQEDTADELSEHIASFVLSLPKSVRQVEEDHIPEHIRQIFDEANADSSHHQHHNHNHHHAHDGHDHGHAHPQVAGYMDAYGLGHAWGH